MNGTELYVKTFYESIGLVDPNELTIEAISEKINLEVIYWQYSSEITNYFGDFKMFINENLCQRQQWQDFGHEMKHFLFDRGNPLILRESFVGYCETKADYFAYHFCVPTFMLANLRGVNVYGVMNLFNVEFDFALRRMEMYKNKLIDRRVVSVL